MFWYLVTWAAFPSRLLIISFHTIWCETAIKELGRSQTSEHLFDEILGLHVSRLWETKIKIKKQEQTDILYLLLWNKHHSITGQLDVSVWRQHCGVLTFPSLTSHHLLLLRIIWGFMKKVSIPQFLSPVGLLSAWECISWAELIHQRL